MTKAYTVLADQEFLEELEAHLDASGFDHDERQEAESMADAADSPIGPQEIQYGLQLLTVAIGAATSLTVLIDKILEVRRKLQSPVPIRVVNPTTGESKITITASMPDEDVRRIAQE